jgi:hypothetical protein
MEDKERQKIIDEEHLKMLSIFYYVLGGVSALLACIPIIHVTIGLFLITLSSSAHSAPGGRPPVIIGLLFVIIGGTVMLLGWTLAALKIYAGYCISKRKKRIFCLVIAVISCLGIPVGTVLGVFTFIVLMRPSVKDLYSQGSSGSHTMQRP